MNVKEQEQRMKTIAAYIAAAISRQKDLEVKIPPFVLDGDEVGLRQILNEYHGEQTFIDLLRWQQAVVSKANWIL